MASENNLREIKEYEEAGIEVIVTSSDGRVEHSTQNADESKYCDSCSDFRLLSDPDPFDSFCSSDMKAVCLNVNGLIAGALGPSEWSNICKPIFCPKLGRELSEDEKEEAAKWLKWAKYRFKRG